MQPPVHNAHFRRPKSQKQSLSAPGTPIRPEKRAGWVQAAAPSGSRPLRRLRRIVVTLAGALALIRGIQLAQSVLGGSSGSPDRQPDSDEGGILTAYLRAAMEHARYRESPSRVIWYHDTRQPGEVFAAIEGLAGVWGQGPDKQVARADLRQALEAFVLTSLCKGWPLPPFNGISLELSETSLETEGAPRTIYPSAPPSSEDTLSALDEFKDFGPSQPFEAQPYPD